MRERWTDEIRELVREGEGWMEGWAESSVCVWISICRINELHQSTGEI